MKIERPTIQSSCRNIIFVNIGVWLLLALTDLLFGQVAPQLAMLDYVALPTEPSAFAHHFWTVFTYAFCHKSVWALAVNMVGFYVVSKQFLRYYTPKQMVSFYLISSWIAAFFALIISILLKQNGQLFGAPGVVVAYFAALAMAQPNARIFNVRFSVIALVVIVISVIEFPQTSAIINLGGALAGALIALGWRRGIDVTKPLNWLIDNTIIIFHKIKSGAKRSAHTTSKPRHTRPKTDAEYNREKAQNRREIDRILDKISKGGYESLSEKERQTLFSHKK